MDKLLIYLDHLSLKEPIKQSGETLALTTLVLPRPGIQKKTALKSFRLQKGKVSLTRKPFYEKALLKEKVDGPFGLTLKITRPVSHGEMQALLRSAVGLGLEVTGDLLARGLSITALRPLLREPFDEFADHLTDDAPDFILEGGFDLDSETMKAGTITMPLKLTQRLRLSSLPPGPKSRNKRKTSAKTYKKGLTIGEVALRLEIG